MQWLLTDSAVNCIPAVTHKKTFVS